MTAQIVMDAGGGPVVGSITLDAADIGTPVTVSNADNTGVAGWQWELLDAPEDSAAYNPLPAPVYTSATVFTPDVLGHTLMVRLTTYKDAARTQIDDIDQKVIRLRFPAPLDWVIPAAQQSLEANTARGWAADVNRILREAHGFSEGGNPTGFPTYEVTASTKISWAAGVFTLEPNAPTFTSFDVYVHGKKYTYSAPLTVAVAGAGVYAVVLDPQLGGLVNTFAAGHIGGVVAGAVPIALVLITDAGDLGLICDLRWPVGLGNTAKAFAAAEGARWLEDNAPTGFSVDGDGSAAAHAQFGLTNGGDYGYVTRFFAAVNGLPLVDPQVITPVLNLARWFYRTGGGLWERSVGGAAPTNALGTEPGENSDGLTLAPLADGQFTLATYFAVPALASTPGVASNREQDAIIAVAGQQVFATVDDARTAAGTVLQDLDLAGLPYWAMVPICTIIIEKNSAFANGLNAIIRSTGAGANSYDHRPVLHNAATPEGPSGGGGGGASAFTDLTDTPANYAGLSLKDLRVNTGETAVEAVTSPIYRSVAVKSAADDGTNVVAGVVNVCLQDTGDYTLKLPAAAGSQIGDTCWFLLINYVEGSRILVTPDNPAAPEALTGLGSRATDAAVIVGESTFYSFTYMGAGLGQPIWQAQRRDVLQTDAWKWPVDVATTGPLPAYTSSFDSGERVLTANANGALTIDGIAASTLQAFDNGVLVKDEVDTTKNGVYGVADPGSAGTPWVLRLRSDWNQPAFARVGMIAVIDGVVNGHTMWSLGRREAADMGFSLTPIQVGNDLQAAWEKGDTITLPNGGSLQVGIGASLILWLVRNTTGAEFVALGGPDQVTNSLQAGTSVSVYGGAGSDQDPGNGQAGTAGGDASVTAAAGGTGSAASGFDGQNGGRGGNGAVRGGVGGAGGAAATGFAAGNGAQLGVLELRNGLTGGAGGAASDTHPGGNGGGADAVIIGGGTCGTGGAGSAAQAAGDGGSVPGNMDILGINGGNAGADGGGGGGNGGNGQTVRILGGNGGAATGAGVGGAGGGIEIDTGTGATVGELRIGRANATDIESGNGAGIPWTHLGDLTATLGLKGPGVGDQGFSDILQTTDGSLAQVLTDVPLTGTDKIVELRATVRGYEPATGDTILHDLLTIARLDGGGTLTIKNTEIMNGGGSGFADAGAAGWVIAVSVSGSNIRYAVTGEALHTINWRVHGRTVDGQTIY